MRKQSYVHCNEKQDNSQNELITQLEILLEAIIKHEGYQEMADGCDQAIEIVKRYFNVKTLELEIGEEYYNESGAITKETWEKLKEFKSRSDIVTFDDATTARIRGGIKL